MGAHHVASSEAGRVKGAGFGENDTTSVGVPVGKDKDVAHVYQLGERRVLQIGNDQMTTCISELLGILKNYFQVGCIYYSKKTLNSRIRMI